MDIQEIRCFTVVAEELNFARAAERLNMSQAPLTRIIARLEHSLQARLFERTTRRVSLTHAGHALLLEAEPLLEKVDQTSRAVRHRISDRSRRFFVGCTKLAFFKIFPEAMERFKKEYPDIEVDVEELPTKTQLAYLQEGLIDVGFLLMPAKAKGITIRSVYIEKMKLAISVNHPLASEPQVNLKDFASDTFIIHPRSESPGLYDEIMHCCNQSGIKPKFRERPRDTSCIGLVCARVGVHFVSASTECIKPEGLIYKEIDNAPTLEMAVAWRKDDPADYLHIFESIPLL